MAHGKRVVARKPSTKPCTILSLFFFLHYNFKFCSLVYQMSDCAIVSFSLLSIYWQKVTECAFLGRILELVILLGKCDFWLFLKTPRKYNQPEFPKRLSWVWISFEEHNQASKIGQLVNQTTTTVCRFFHRFKK